MHPAIEFPEHLPVSARRDDIMAAMRAHQVVIVCGETGSGKTTQLPKMAWLLQQERESRLSGNPPKRRKIIGHTQPRRIAASTVAKRVADELKTPMGEFVGYKVRFADRLGPNAAIKLMTDGILLAETQTDPELRAYDTLIIDEAHERSLNIDFLLGYLRQLLARRPDLRVVVTSATIDADRFAQHFASAKGPAPVIQVSGRLFPVLVRYRPFEESREFDLNDAIAEGVDELLREPTAQSGGDVLVFLPGEREIREAADHLRRHFSHKPHLRNTEVMPLFARLSQAEQEAVFQNHSNRRVVLATNVAETSLTVPGVRFVVDAGTARVKRYSFRNKVEQLMVEPISQAAANQRAGRCGRVADGICIRLYAEADFALRGAFTDPEILRSSLAGVILRMKSLHLGVVDDFPFIEPPQRRAIVDGYQLLAELGAVDDANELTALGAQLAKLPLDPRVGRMLIEARERGALDEVLVIASALSVQDVRDRPAHAQAAADTAHKQFDDDKSEFSGYLRLWDWLRKSRGGENGVHKLSNRQHDNLLRDTFINLRRVREWRDVHSQLVQTVQEQHWPINTVPASFEALHMSLLAGFIGNVGCKSDDEDWYLGARGIKFWRHPGANLSKKPGRWLVVGELIETTRVFGRSIATVEPQWIERAAQHLIKRQLLDAHWSKRNGEVVALERGTLYGLVIYNNRQVNFSRIDPVGAREIFIRQGLMGGEDGVAGLGNLSEDATKRLPFLAHNAKVVRRVQELEHKSRRQDVLVDDELIFAFYDAQIAADVASVDQLERWLRRETKQNPEVLRLTQDALMRHEAAGVTAQAFPKLVRLGGVDCAVSYLHEPGDAKDGVTATVPLFALNQVNEDRLDWLVPGMLKDKVQALLKSLPQKSRGRLVPLPESAQRITDAILAPARFGVGPLVDAVLKQVRADTELDVKRSDLKADALQAHQLMNLRVVDEHGRQLGSGRSLGALRAELGTQARGAFAQLAQLAKTELAQVGTENFATNRHLASDSKGFVATNNIAIQALKTPVQAQTRHTSWDFGELPELMEITQGSGKNAHTVIGFPALVDAKDAVTLEVFDEPEVAATRHRAGLRRLFALQLKEHLRLLEKNLPDLQKTAMLYASIGSADELREQIVGVAIDRAFLQDPLPTDADSFKTRTTDGRGRLALIAHEVARLAASILVEYTAATRKLKDSRASPEVALDLQQQLQRLCPKRFIEATPYPQLAHMARYLKAITMRLDKLRTDPARDTARMAELRGPEQRFWRLVTERKGNIDARLHEYRWLLEELRVSLFAQELRTPTPVSIKRLEKAWSLLNP